MRELGCTASLPPKNLIEEIDPLCEAAAEMVALAREHGMVLLKTTKRMYEACGKLYANGLVGNGVAR